MLTSFVPGLVFFDLDGDVQCADPETVRLEREPGTGHLKRGGLGYLESCIFSGMPEDPPRTLVRKVIWAHMQDTNDEAVDRSLAYVAEQVTHLRSLGDDRPRTIVWYVGSSPGENGIVESYVAVDRDFEDEVFGDMYAPAWFYERPNAKEFIPPWVREWPTDAEKAALWNLGYRTAQSKPIGLDESRPSRITLVTKQGPVTLEVTTPDTLKLDVAIKLDDRLA